MNTIKTRLFNDDETSTRGYVWGALGWFTVAAMLLLSLGAGAADEGATQTEATAAQTIVARSAAERAWNEQEDLKAGGYVGQPGIY